MRAWTDNFSTPTVRDWLQKAEKDLKGKSLQDLSWTWEDHIRFDPAYFDTPNDNFKVPHQTKAWSIAEPFVFKSSPETNKDILQALQMGVEHLYIVIPTFLSESDWSDLFDKVVLSYIQITIDFRDTEKANFDTLHSYLQTIEWTPEQLFLLVHHAAHIPDTLTACRRVVADIHVYTEQPALQLAKQMRQAELLLQQNNTVKQIIFNIFLHQSFYHNIAWIQAVKILWQNILDAHQQDPLTSIQLVAQIEENDSHNENTQKINATIQAISAVVCGIDSLVIHPPATKDQNFDRRINRNIQHLMKLESYMDQVMNPTEGAYYFEHLTKELAEAAWTHFQDLD
jgi:methylmalonyl-CoA mutase